MSVHSGWENAIDLFWEYPLGNIGSTVQGFRYLSDVPDSLTIGAESHSRKVIGNRFMRKEHLRILKTTPGGSLGPTPMWFSATNRQTNLNRLLNSHFQNQKQACGIPPAPCWSRHFPVSTQPTNLGGFTIRRNIGLGATNSYVWTSAITDKLTIDWRVGMPVMLTPEMRTLWAMPGEAVSITANADSAYQRYYYQAPALNCLWNGTAFNPAGWRITSQNNIITQWGPSSKQPIGFNLGQFQASLELDVWIDDNFLSWFVPKANIGTSSTPADTLGTFYCKVEGPFDDYAGTLTQFNTIFEFIGKIVDIPGANPNMGNQPTHKVKAEMVASGTTYNTCGYYIEIQEESHNWQNPS